ncbi:lysophospholipid acyltransferase family protein [Angustibacter luteus]|uniref:Lysophospholipid acyltransferase family protein n=1 Tax=Angustibacter luteus TaxID=658456 RepID=A0ABW1JFP0_9ACTN
MSSEQDGRVIPLDRGRAKGGAKPAAMPLSKPAPKPTGKGADVLAAGARRASGERAKRRGTPLIADSAPPPVPEVIPPGDQPTHGGALNPATLLQHAVGAIVEALVTEGRRAGVADVDQHVAHALAFLRRRLSGDYVVDEFGFDADLTEAVLPALRPLYRSWFRVEVRGIENIPHTGGALVVANHSGTIAMDSLMTQLAVHDEHPASRNLRMLGADLVFAAPFVGSFARKTGTTLAIQSDAERLLRSGELVGVWPEGFKGIGKPFSERYKLQRFGRGGFVSAALQAGVPIVPCSIVGAEEIYPILGNFKSLARLLGVPYLPMTPTFPWLGPLGLIPLPSKWIIEFGAPIDTADLDGGADDPMLVFNITDQVRETIQQTLYALLMQRRSVFFS